MGTKRKALSKKIRFEIFKRDNFTCQYCGRKAPDIVLNVDHINPISKGGTNDIFNLITSCFDCNNGKRDIPLDKQSELDKQRAELELLQERKEQIDMMFEWKKELCDLDNYEISRLHQYVLEKYGINLTEHGDNLLKNCIQKYGIEETINVIDISISQYGITEFAISYIEKICKTRQMQNEHPEIREINYLCKIGENRLKYFDKKKMKHFLRKNYDSCHFNDLKEIFCTSKNWTVLANNLYDYYLKDVRKYENH